MRKAIFFTTQILLSLFLLVTTIEGQTGNTTIRKYQMLDYLNDLIENDPLTKNNLLQAQDQITSSVLNSSFTSSDKKVAIVFHVLWRTNEEKVSKPRLSDQIAALNRDFNGISIDNSHWNERSTNFSAVPSNPQIEFCKPVTNPFSNIGDVYKYVNQVEWNDFNEMKSVGTGGSNPFDPTKYLNVWICNLSDEISGYAQMPGGPNNLDGIVIDYRYMINGPLSDFDEGKTLTHLVGNYLGLFPLWGPRSDVDDNVYDTPIHNAPNYGCPIPNHLSASRNFSHEMTMNFMDNSNDVCTYMFTEGQKERMQACLSTGGPRSGLAMTQVSCGSTSGGRSSEINIAKQIYLIPSITDSEFSLHITGYNNIGDIQVSVFSIDGALMLDELFKSEIGIVRNYNGDSWPSGMYTIHVQSEAFQEIKRLIIQK